MIMAETIAMDTYDIAYASQHPAELLERVGRGEDVSISDPSLGTMRLVPAPRAKPFRLA